MFLKACAVVYVASVILSWILTRKWLKSKSFNADIKDVLLVLLPLANSISVISFIVELTDFNKIYKKFFLLK